MNIFKSKIVARGMNLRAVAIRCFAVGVIVTWMWNGHSTSSPSRFLVHLEPEPETILEDRDLSDYALGGETQDCFNNFEDEPRECEAQREKARDFILRHWRSKRRAYIEVQFNAIDNFSDHHGFIEPNQHGEWEIVWRSPMYLFNYGRPLRVAVYDRYRC
jgi:hypothetical protein